ncbi:hypothetical protein FIU87_14975 [Bacillus sp. THAF10]|nr:hypothetical protein FIU87_14975 [Bacillus sp. THAF10]
MFFSVQNNSIYFITKKEGKRIKFRFTQFTISCYLDRRYVHFYRYYADPMFH